MKFLDRFKPAQKKEAVVLVHGLWMNRWVMRYLGWQFRRRKIKVYYFGYPSMRNSLQENVTALQEFIATIPQESICLVGHSLGGIICTEYLQQVNAGKVQRCLLLGTPINGSGIAQYMSERKWGQKMLGESASVLTKIHAHKLDKRFGQLIGTGGKGLGQLFGPLRKPHDGAVAYHEADPGGQVQTIVLPVSHSTMLFSKMVARSAIEFCCKGGFPENIAMH